MKFPIDHKEGQYKAGLFEELIYFLLVNIYDKDTIKRHFLLPKKSDRVSSSSIDFVVEKANNKFTIVEAKAAYTETPSKGLNRSFRRIKSLYDRYPFHESINEIIIAINTELPNKSLEEYEKTKEYFEKKGIEFKLWDFLFIKHLLEKKLD